MKNKVGLPIIGAVVLALLIAAGISLYFILLNDGHSEDVAYNIGHKVYLTENDAACYSVIECRSTDSFKDASGNEHTSENGSKFLIVTVAFDFSDTDYSAADIAAVSECFKNTDDHRFDKKLTNAWNFGTDSTSIKDAAQKKGSISAVDIVKNDFVSEYMEIGIINKHGIGEHEKFIIK